MNFKVLAAMCLILLLAVPDSDGWWYSRRRRRRFGSDVANSPSSSESYYSYKIPLPYKFNDYDKNKDGRIDYAEFKKTLPHVSEEKEIRRGFDIADKNGDHYIDCKEFLKANFDFGGKKPTCK